ncbi:FAA-hydrolase domain-containing protein [Fusarium sp. Ph1]|nr:FAA-hydrolase domain-containing protein [Fusarium sp. Ph1]
MKNNFERLVRFQDPSGRVLYGEAPSSGDPVGQEVPVYAGDDAWDLMATATTAKISKVSSPLPRVPIIYGIGLNDKTHISEAGFPTPKHPTVFTKPPDALSGPFDDVHVHPECTNVDHEGELAVIIGQDCKYVTSSEDALKNVLGYPAANDVSSRYWQLPEISGQQHGYAKSFDGFAPLGPVIASPTALGDVNQLTLVTKVNGEERQRAQLNDLLFGVGDLIAHLSRGTTLRAGTVILTGSPSGVAAFMKPPAWLKDVDTVLVSISEIGSITNRLVFE